MKERRVWGDLLGLTPPWRVRDVEYALDEGEVRIFVEVGSRAKLRCRSCERECAGYDARERRWRHLDTMQYRTIVIARVPRVECPEHGVVQVEVPWAEASSRFTARFEALVIDWLLEASFAAVARQVDLTWDEVAGIQDRAVRRGLARRDRKPPKRIGVDETSFQRRHESVTTVNDLDAGVVLYVADDRKQESLDAFYDGLGTEACAGLEAVVMDMWAPYIASTREHVPEAERKIVFDKFHVAKHLGEAVDQVRRQENRELRAEGDERLVKTKYLWLWNPDRMSRERWREFAPLRSQSPAGGAGLGDQGGGDALVGLRQARLGRADVAALVRLGDPLSPRAGEAGRADDPEALAGSPERGDEQRDERPLRGTEQQDPVDQA